MWIDPEQARLRIVQMQSEIKARTGILRKLCTPKEKPTDSTGFQLMHPDDLVSAHPRKYLSDVLDHVNEISNSIQTAELTLETSFQHYVTRINLELAASNTVMASHMENLSMIATLMVPMSLVAGLFGMNVNVPGQEADGLWVFWTIIGSMIGICVTTLIGWTMYKKFRRSSRQEMLSFTAFEKQKSESTTPRNRQTVGEMETILEDRQIERMVSGNG
eukprot:c20134_g1_i2.p1 GENE.c20134_g1_i2~~c20134_g1_i2.p1  ORF type:complete len:218 (-),score=28.18 c20134_g1_i2:31-684(-)